MRPFILLLSLLLAAKASAGTFVQFRTIYGDIDVELFDADKPATVQNFLRYAKAGLYRDTFFHRCVPNFVVQGGGFYTTNRYANSNLVNVFNIQTFPPIPNEFGVGRRISNTFGTIAMAKVGGDTNSATSQWYFNTVDNPFLDANDSNNLFVVFGKAVAGTNLLAQYNSRAPNFGIYTNFGGVFGTLPVNYVGNFYPFYSDLIYVDVTLLNVKVLRTNFMSEISWNSVSGKTNVVQFTTQFPPVWQTLVTTNGNGNTLSVSDAASSDGSRFYRVIVSY